MTDPHALEPCPHCGPNGHPETKETVSWRPGLVGSPPFVKCAVCHATAPTIAAWNRRVPPAPLAPLQPRVQSWMMACFGPEISADRVERGDRLLEEVFEMLQSNGYDPGRIIPLRDYVWGRPIGEPAQEVGGVMITLAAYCLAHGVDMHEAGETELARIWTKVETIRAKQAAKPRHSPLPIAAPLAPRSRPMEALPERDWKREGDDR